MIVRLYNSTTKRTKYRYCNNSKHSVRHKDCRVKDVIYNYSQRRCISSNNSNNHNVDKSLYNKKIDKLNNNHSTTSDNNNKQNDKTSSTTTSTAELLSNKRYSMQRLRAVIVTCSITAVLLTIYLQIIQQNNIDDIDDNNQASDTLQNTEHQLDTANVTDDDPVQSDIDTPLTQLNDALYILSQYNINNDNKINDEIIYDSINDIIHYITTHFNENDIDISLLTHLNALNTMLNIICDPQQSIVLQHISSVCINLLCEYTTRESVFLRWLRHNYNLDAQLSLLHYSDLHRWLLRAHRYKKAKTKLNETQLDNALLELISILLQLRPQTPYNQFVDTLTDNNGDDQINSIDNDNNDTLTQSTTSTSTTTSNNNIIDNTSQAISKHFPWIWSYLPTTQKRDLLTLSHPIQSMKSYIRNVIDLSEPGLQLIQNDIKVIQQALRPSQQRIERSDVAYHTLRAISTLTQIEGVSQRFVDSNGIELLSSICHAYMNHIKVQIQTARLCADLLSSGDIRDDNTWQWRYDVADRIANNSLLPILHHNAYQYLQQSFNINNNIQNDPTLTSLSSQKNKLQHQSIRAIHNLQSVCRYHNNVILHSNNNNDDIQPEPLYDDDILPVNTFKNTLSQHYDTYQEACSILQSAKQPTVDIIFIHGLLGNPIGTWRGLVDNITANNNITSDLITHQQQAMYELQNNDDIEIYWPRDWLSRDMPHTRIISVGYNSLLSTRFGSPSSDYSSIISKPIVQRANDLLYKLEKSQIGHNHGIIWITHSLGGLLCKQILALSEQRNIHRHVLNNTIGCIFYSVPHLGVWMPSVFNVLYRPSTELAELKARSPLLLRLNDKLYNYWQDYNVGVLSYSETEQTTLPPKANPNTRSKQSNSNVTTNNNKDNTTTVTDAHTRSDNIDESVDDRRVLGSPLSWLSQPSVSYMLVEKWSSNPGFGLNIICNSTDHYTVCKPQSKQDIKYKQTIQFINDMITLHNRQDIRDQYIPSYILSNHNPITRLWS